MIFTSVKSSNRCNIRFLLKKIDFFFHEKWVTINVTKVTTYKHTGNQFCVSQYMWRNLWLDSSSRVITAVKPSNRCNIWFLLKK